MSIKKVMKITFNGAWSICEIVAGLVACGAVEEYCSCPKFLKETLSTTALLAPIAAGEWLRDELNSEFEIAFDDDIYEEEIGS